MAFIIDAAIAAAWFLPDERHPVAEKALQMIRHDTAAAPSLWRFEMRNLLLTSERRGRIGAEQTAQALRLLGALPIEIDGQCEDETLLRIARKHRLTAYDAAYLELALRRREPLATLDAELATAARAEGVALIAP
jgi:predicted nucleic acid-binding protein